MSSPSPDAPLTSVPVLDRPVLDLPVLKLPVLTVVVPCFDEEAVLPEASRQLRALLSRFEAEGRVAAGSHVCFVDDGSKDGTWRVIAGLAAAEPARFGGLKLSRNRGHQNALLAGLLASRGDVVISADADLQDDLEAMAAMLDAHAAGADIVYGVRSARHTDTAAKRISARMFYRLLGWLDVEVVFDHADYRLMSRRAVDALHEYGETNLFLRALIPLLGFTPAIVTYERAERFAGESKYPLRKMFALALEGVTSFSTRPLRYVTMLGFALSGLSLALTLWALLMSLAGSTVPGWASTVVPIYLVCGVQLLSLGVIGEYVGKIYLETKRRPRFHVAEAVGAQAAEANEVGGVAGEPSPDPAPRSMAFHKG